MRILLAQNALYYPSYGGGDRSNRLLLEALAARGHECRVVARIARFGAAGHAQYLGELAARAVSPMSTDGGVVVFRRAGVEAHVVTQHPNLRAYFSAQIAAFAPASILTSGGRSGSAGGREGQGGASGQEGLLQGRPIRSQHPAKGRAGFSRRYRSVHGGLQQPGRHRAQLASQEVPRQRRQVSRVGERRGGSRIPFFTLLPR